MMDRGIPMEVLSQAIVEKIAGRAVQAGVFTTYSFDPGFFELNVLPLLFDQPFGPVDKLKRVQLEDCLRNVQQLAVYYDGSALAQESEPSFLPYTKIDVRRSTGVFHPKIIFLLVEATPEQLALGTFPVQSLIVAIQSANLTRSGWWDNVECAHIEEIVAQSFDDKPVTFRSDLLKLINAIKKSAKPNDDHDALELVRSFLRANVSSGEVRATVNHVYQTRVFSGSNQLDFSEWLHEKKLDKHDWNLEVISPYFSSHGAGPLEKLLDLIPVREARIYLPCDDDGKGMVKPATYAAVKKLGAHWSAMEKGVTQRSGGEANTLRRRVHAKVYRFWEKGGRNLLVSGSVNLTSSAHSKSSAGNLEAAFFVDITQSSQPRRWWLEPIEKDIEQFVEQPPDELENCDQNPIDVAVKYDWVSNALAYRVSEACNAFELKTTAGVLIFAVKKVRHNDWVALPPSSAGKVRQLLESTSFIEVDYAGGRWRILVREENASHRPSLLVDLTTEEILEYWALLTPEQRAFFLERHAAEQSSLEGLKLNRGDKLANAPSLFSKFSGIFHAFGALERHIENAITEGNFSDAEVRLCGAKYDSLPSLLDKTLADDGWDPILRYVTFLCAHQMVRRIEEEYPQFYSELGIRRLALDSCLNKFAEVRVALPQSEIDGGEKFLEWYESAFLGEVEASEVHE